MEGFLLALKSMGIQACDQDEQILNDEKFSIRSHQPEAGAKVGKPLLPGHAFLPSLTFRLSLNLISLLSLSHLSLLSLVSCLLSLVSCLLSLVSCLLSLVSSLFSLLSFSPSLPSNFLSSNRKGPITKAQTDMSNNSVAIDRKCFSALPEDTIVVAVRHSAVSTKSTKSSKKRRNQVLNTYISRIYGQNLQKSSHQSPPGGFQSIVGAWTYILNVTESLPS
ncbi:hypothetical protein N7516_007176 [Penicillium verrucosum]|uniref:uncharacterized protein n=1 Tax=Penicillium verrucosum TaxID=60171 RepID=UPI002545AB91|nr:uncharacterized protein N7516_007176 [Penicillium verrucosum]KAJ5932687.1 hypothetical protein N7516_007176 [Penicillium verrucosum]